MKIKGDFVTNSSSVSIVLWGLRFETSEFFEKYGEEIFRKLHVVLGPDLSLKNKDDYLGERHYPHYEDLRCDLEAELNKHGLTVETTEYSDLYIGGSPWKMKDDETKVQYQERICKVLGDYGIPIEVKDLMVIEESWYNG